MKNHHLFLLVFFIVLVSRLPFLEAGYGNDQDGWRVATAARYIATTGEYKASRLPGFPVVELVYSLIWRHGAWAMNLLSALASAVAVGILSLIAKHYGCRDSLLLALTFAFTPIVFISSTITMDYLWAMMFVMLSWYTGLYGKPIAAGFLLGIATGCRITTAAMALPFALLFFERPNWKLSQRNIMKFWIAAGVVIALLFSPVLSTYGIRFFTYFHQGLPPFIFITRFITLDVWGAVGSVAVAAMLILMIMNRKRNFDSSIPKTIPLEHVRIWIAVIILYLVEFAALPDEGAYVIPAIPFLLLLSARYLPRMQFRMVCILIILSSFIVSIDSADRPWCPEPSRHSVKVGSIGRTIAIDFLQGPFLHDYAKRKQRMEFIKKVVRAGDNLNEPSVIIVGVWLPSIIEMTPNAIPESEFPDYSLLRGNVEYVPLLTPEFLNRFRQEHRRLYYFTTIDEYNKKVTSLDLKQAGADELKIE